MIKGDTVREVLDYVEFDADDLAAAPDVETAVREGRIGYEEAGRLLRFYEDGLGLGMVTSKIWSGARRARRAAIPPVVRSNRQHLGTLNASGGIRSGARTRGAYCNEKTTVTVVNDPRRPVRR